MLPPRMNVGIRKKGSLVSRIAVKATLVASAAQEARLLLSKISIIMLTTCLHIF